MDLKFIQSKLNELNKKPANDIIWKPTPGETHIRIVPLASSPDNPFQELYFHYLGGKTYLSPLSYGEADPIAEFSDKLIGGGGLSKEEWKEAKKFYPVKRTYAPIVERGKEDVGVKFWAFGQTVFKSILTAINDPDYGDISDVNSGHDIKVIFTEKEKSDTGFAKTDIIIRPKPCVLSNDVGQLKKLQEQQPVLLDSFKKYTYDELKKILADYLHVVADDPFESPGTVVENKAQVTEPDSAPSTDDWASPETEPTPAKTSRKKAPVVSNTSLDEEFDAAFNS